MPFNGSGTYSPPSPPNFPAISGSVITASYYNTVINDIAAGLSLCLTKDGQSSPSGAINWNAQNLTNVATLGAVTINTSGTLTANVGTFTTGLTLAGNTVWTSGNDGPGSGLNADLLDGQEGAYYANIPARLGYTPANKAGDTITGLVTISYPQAKLVVDTSDVSVSGSNFSSIELADVSATRAYFRSFRDGTGKVALGYNSFLTFVADVAGSPTERARFLSSGTLLLGLTAAIGTENFTVGANQNSMSGAVFRNTNTGASAYAGVVVNASGNSWAMRMGSTAANSNSLSFCVDALGSPTDRLTITSAGAVGIPGSLAVTGALTVGGNAVATQNFVTTSYAPLASPALTGAPTAPTAAVGTNTTQLATTAFVAALGALKADLASPAFTGTPTSGGIEIGYRNIPRVTGGVDAGKCNAISAGLTLNTGPAAGTTYSIYNDSAAAVTITQGAGLTLRLGGTATTGNRTLAARGFATVWYNSTTEAIMQGSGVS